MQITSEHVNVSQLWQRLEEMERELRFDGKAYPDGMCSFPFRLKGQGFFPGGDGLWRQDDELGEPTNGVLHQHGALFLGNDFGTIKTYEHLRFQGFEVAPTWSRLKRRASQAGIPTEATSFKNAIMGLREVGTALTKKSWIKMPKFSRFCGEFLAYQLALLKPRLTVVMGPDARAAFDTLANATGVGQVLYTTHPYGDFNFSPDRLATDIDILKRAWQCA